MEKATNTLFCSLFFSLCAIGCSLFGINQAQGPGLSVTETVRQQPVQDKEESLPIPSHEATMINTKQRHPLVNIQTRIPHIQVELKYATADNFTGQVVYPFHQCLVLEAVAKRLGDIQAELETMGLGLKIWDGFRPMAAQWKFWELVPDERYVGDPKKGGRHTRGTAVDLTLVTKEGIALPMPSAFDDFSERAHQDYQGATHEEIANRELLRSIMEKHGFKGLETEWWHFDLIGWEAYPPLDIGLQDDVQDLSFRQNN